MYLLLDVLLGDCFQVHVCTFSGGFSSVVDHAILAITRPHASPRLCSSVILETDAKMTPLHAKRANAHLRIGRLIVRDERTNFGLNMEKSDRIWAF